jgi:hypothetical protein
VAWLGRNPSLALRALIVACVRSLLVCKRFQANFFHRDSAKISWLERVGLMRYHHEQISAADPSTGLFFLMMNARRLMSFQKIVLCAMLMLPFTPACDSVSFSGGGDAFPDECILEFGTVGLLVDLGGDEFLGLEVEFDGIDLIVDGFVVGTLIIENDIISLTIDEPFEIFDPEFDTVFDAEFDGFLTVGECGTDLLFDGFGTITLGDSFDGFIEVFDIIDITLPPNFDI